MDNSKTISASNAEQKKSFNRIEYIYTSVGKNTFTDRVLCFALFLFVLGIVQLVALGMIGMKNPEMHDWLWIVEVGNFAVCYILAFVLFFKADKIGKESQMYGIAVVDVLNKENLDLLEKNLYFVMTRVDLSGKIPSAKFHITSYGRMKEIAEREKALSEELGAIQAMMKNQAFWESLEKNIKGEIIYDDCWYVTPMRDASIQRTGLFGSTIDYRDARGVFREFFLSRDFEEYKEVKKIINQWGIKKYG